MGMYVKSLEGLRKDRERTARMGLVDRGYKPSADKIREECAKIRAGWTAKETEARSAYPVEYTDFLKVVRCELFEPEWFEGMVDKL